jgi:hypothetical protein
VPAVAVEDLTMLLPSVILALTPYLMNAMEAALGLSLMGSIVLTVVVASLCTGLYFIGLGTFRPAIAERADCGEAPMLRLSSIGTPPPRQPVAPAAAQI